MIFQDRRKSSKRHRLRILCRVTFRDFGVLRPLRRIASGFDSVDSRTSSTPFATLHCGAGEAFLGIRSDAPHVGLKERPIPPRFLVRMPRRTPQPFVNPFFSHFPRSCRKHTKPISNTSKPSKRPYRPVTSRRRPRARSAPCSRTFQPNAFPRSKRSARRRSRVWRP